MSTRTDTRNYASAVARLRQGASRAALTMALMTAGFALAGHAAAGPDTCTLTDGDKTATCTGDQSGGVAYSATVNKLDVKTTSTTAGPVSLTQTGGNGGKGSDDKDIDSATGGTGGTGSGTDALTATVQSDLSATGTYGLYVRSTAGNGGDGGYAGATVAHGGRGGTGGTGGSATADYQSGTMSVTGTGAHGLVAFSYGGNGGNGGGADGVDATGGKGGDGGSAGHAHVVNGGAVTTSGTGAYGAFVLSQGGRGGSGSGAGGISASGADGGAGGAGGNAEVSNNGNIVTWGAESYGVLIQSVGGPGGGAGGGSGIFGGGGDGSSGGTAGTVIFNGTGTIVTNGRDSHGVLAQSVGGGGGASGSGAGIVGIGGNGGAGSNGGTVDVDSQNDITTHGSNSHALFGQSIGGGGGTVAGSGGLVAIGGDGTTAGDAGTVDMTSSGDLTTTDDDSFGMIGQSIGGGGGQANATGGAVAIGGKGSAGGKGGTVLLTNNGAISTIGARSAAIYGQSIGGGGGSAAGGGGVVAIGGDGSSGGEAGTVTLTNTGTATTTGEYAYGMFGQSVGGGGGSGSFSGGLVGIGGKGDKGGAGGIVTLTNNGSVTTEKLGAVGLFGQSIGGGGGAGGGSGGLVAIGGSGDGGGDGGKVTIGGSGSVATQGDDAAAIFAQSVGGGGGAGGFAASGGLFASVAVGGKGEKGGVGGEVDVSSHGTLTTQGDRSFGVYAQSIGGGGGAGGFAVSGSIGAFGSVAVAIGGGGGAGGAGGHVTTNTGGSIFTDGAGAHGLYAQSVGGGGGAGGYSFAAAASGGEGASVSASVSVGGTGGKGGTGGLVDVVTDTDIETFQADSHGIFAQSVGGGGGNGGWAGSFAAAGSDGFAANLTAAVGGAGGDGGLSDTVTVNSTGTLTTHASGSHGLFAQSVGGGGGSGGFAVSGAVAVGGGGAANLKLALGGTGGKGGAGGEVIVSSLDAVSTTGDYSDGILAQSVGGGGGNGGWSGTFGLAVGVGSGSLDAGASVGGSGGDGGLAKRVDVTTSGDITTLGKGSMGLVAQSIGGGGGNGGYSLAGNFAFGTTGVALGVSVGGTGGKGGEGGTVTVRNGSDISTKSDGAHALLAQSVGGGGGNGGWSGALSGAGGSSNAVALSAAVGGNGGSGGKAVAVDVTSDGTLWTKGKQAYGLLAQSVGGGGGNGGFALTGALSGAGQTSVSGSLAVGGCFSISAVCAGGAGGTVTVRTHDWVATEDDLSTGLIAQSIGGGGGNGGWVGQINGAFGQSKSAALGLALGGNGGNGGNGDTVIVVADKWISTQGDSAVGLLAQSVGGGGGNGGFAISGAMSGGGENGLSVSAALGGCLVQQAAYVGGAIPSCSGGTGGTVGVTTKDAIWTHGDLSTGLIAQSIGGGGGNGGWAGSFAATANSGRSVSVGASLGGFGGVGGKAGQVTVNSEGASIVTVGDQSFGLLAQSVGGGGGNGGVAVAATFGGAKSINLSPSLGGFGGKGGEGGAVTVDNDATIWTKGDLSVGLLAQSVGGGGGNGGNSGSIAFGGTESVNIAAAVGGKGGEGNIANTVDVGNTADILTEGQMAYGIQAQAIGGGGGNGGMAGLDKDFWGKYVTGLECFGNNCFDGGGGALSGGFGAKTQSVAISVGGFGGTGGDGGRVILDNSGDIMTKGDDADVIFAQSVGGGGGTGGVSTSGTAAFGASDSGSYSVTLGGFGGAAGDGKLVQVKNSGILHAKGAGSLGIFAQSVGGGGGAGGDARGFYLQRALEQKDKAGKQVKSGFELAVAIGGFGGAAGDGGEVQVTNDGSIYTDHADGIGIMAQSIGGGGGKGGKASTSADEINALFEKDAVDDKKKWRVAIGGWGGAAGDGGVVTVTNNGTIQTKEGGAHGIFAQSVGGGGGDGGGAGAGLSGRVAIGGFGGAAGDGGVVTVTNTHIVETLGISAHGIFAQSIGGGGGTGGNASFGSLRSAYDEIIKKVRLEGKQAGKKLYEDRFKKEISFAMGGWGGAAGDGGAVTVTNSGTVHTAGDLSYGIYAQSVGGGGGDGGNGYMSGARKFAIGGVGGSSGDGGDIIITNSGDITVDGYGSYGIFAQSIGGGGGKIGDLGLGVESFSLDTSLLAEFALGGGDGGDITINSSGNINVTNPGGMAFFAQSVGGSGGLVGGGAFAVMGSLGGSGKGGKVTVNYTGNLVAAQTNGIAAVLQSDGGTGNSDIKARFDGSLIGGDVLGRGLRISGGVDNTVELTGLTRAGSGVAIEGDKGNDTIENKGAVIGNVLLGTGINNFNNRADALFITFDSVYLNNGRLLNEGLMMFGENAAGTSGNPALGIQPGTQVTALTGNFTQAAGGEMAMDLRFGTGGSDRLEATGWAGLGGTITPHLLTLNNSNPLTLVKAAGGVTDNGLIVHDTLAADYSLVYTATEAKLDITTHFGLNGMTQNFKAVGAQLDGSVEAGVADKLGTTLAFFANLTDRPTYDAAFAGMVPEQELAFAQAAFNSSLANADAVMSCRTPGAAANVLDEGECVWARQADSWFSHDTTASDEGFKQDSSMAMAGAQVHFGDNLYFGMAAGQETSDLHSDTYRMTGGLRTQHVAFAVKRVTGQTLVAASFNAGFSKLNATRVVDVTGPQIAQLNDTGATSYTLRGRVAHVFGGDNLYLKLQADAGVTQLTVDGYAETGAGPLNVIANAQERTAVWMAPRIEVGARFKAGNVTIQPWAFAGGRLTDDNVAELNARFEGSPATVKPFTLTSRGDEATRTAGGGVDLIGQDHLTLSVGYQGDFGKRDHDEQGYVKLAYRF